MAKKIELLVAGIVGLLAGGLIFGLGLQRGLREAHRASKHAAASRKKHAPPQLASPAFERRPEPDAKEPNEGRRVPRAFQAATGLRGNGSAPAAQATRRHNATSRLNRLRTRIDQHQLERDWGAHMDEANPRLRGSHHQVRPPLPGQRKRMPPPPRTPRGLPKHTAIPAALTKRSIPAVKKPMPRRPPPAEPVAPRPAVVEEQHQ